MATFISVLLLQPEMVIFPFSYAIIVAILPVGNFNFFLKEPWSVK